MKSIRLITGIHRRRIIAPLRLACALFCLVNAPANAQNISPAELADVWTDRSYGLMLRPPADARLVPGQPNGPLAHFTLKNQYTISVMIAHSDIPLSPEALKTHTTQQVVISYPDVRSLPEHERAFEIHENPGWTLYFLVPDPQHGHYIIGQSTWRIDDVTWAVIRLETEPAQFDDVREIYEAVVKTLNLLPPEQLRQQREALLDRGQRMLDKIEFAQLTDVLEDEQWLRILSNGKDMGYMRIRESKSKQANRDGVLIEITARLQRDDQMHDQELKFFLAGEPTPNPGNPAQRHREEYWTAVTTVRIPQNPIHRNDRKKPQTTVAASWAYTGVRGYTQTLLDGKTQWVNQLTVTEEKLSSVETHQWPTPDKAYLSRVHDHLLPRLVERTENREMAFYAYSPVTREINFRTDRIELLNDGSFKIFTRPSLDSPERTAHYDFKRRLIRKTLETGQELLPATPEKIKAIWQLK